MNMNPHPECFAPFALIVDRRFMREWTRDPAHVRMRLGTLANDARAKIVAHVWVLSRPDWYSICDDLAQFERGLTSAGIALK